MGNLIRATNLIGYEELVSHLGGDPNALLNMFGIPLLEDRQDRSFLPFKSVAALFEVSATQLSCPDFGLRLSQYQGLNILGPISVIARNSPTVEQALNKIAQYLYFHCPSLELKLIHGEGIDFASLRLEIYELHLLQSQQGYELSAGNGMKILQLLGGDKFIPQRVTFKHPQIAPMEAYTRTFKCKVNFEQSWCGIQIPLSALKKELASIDVQAKILAEQFLGSSPLPESDLLSSRVTALINSLLPTRNCNNSTIARQLAMHPRTLQRKLAKEGITFEAMLDQERRQLAEQYLSHPDMRFDHITGLLGYSEQAVFNRACRRWFGMTPTKVRESLCK